MNAKSNLPVSGRDGRHRRDSAPGHVHRRRCGVTRAALLCGLAIALPAHADAYAALEITSPADGTTIHDNDGRMTVTAAASPPLQADRGDRFVFLVDGAAMPPLRTGRQPLAHLDRGSHTLQVEVVDATNRPLITSAPRTVYLWHASALMPHPSHP